MVSLAHGDVRRWLAPELEPQSSTWVLSFDPRRSRGRLSWLPSTFRAAERRNDDVADGVAEGMDQSAQDIELTAEAASGDLPLSDAERGERLAALMGVIELMRPAVQSDGGDLALVSADVETGVVEVQLQGACSSCAVSSSTLQGGVDRILRGRLDWVTEVIGGVDDSIDPFASESMGRGGYIPSH
jgi:hypothetical protein